MTALVTRGLGVAFAGTIALSDIDLSVDRGQILGLIGPNGAGKTTLTNALTGFQRYRGAVVVDGSEVTGWPARKLARSGVRRSFQAVRLFPGMTVRENLEATGLGMGLGSRRARRETAERLAWWELTEVADRPATALSYGLSRRLGIARAMVGPLRYLLLDEPAAGLNEQESDELLERLRAIPSDFGCGLLVIEHDMRLIMRLCHRIQVIDYGRTLAVGTPARIRSDTEVIRAYLGSGIGTIDA